jgi:hypothetical protein
MFLLRIICATDMKRATQLPLYRAVLFKQQRAVPVFVPSNMAYKHKLQYSAFLCFPIYLSLTLASLSLSSCVLVLPLSKVHLSTDSIRFQAVSLFYSNYCIIICVCDTQNGFIVSVNAEPFEVPDIVA